MLMSGFGAVGEIIVPSDTLFRVMLLGALVGVYMVPKDTSAKVEYETPPPDTVLVASNFLLAVVDC